MDIREVVASEISKSLLHISDPPPKLWLRGSMPTAGTKILTVVGSRALSQYGKEACELLISGLAGYPISIVSGLAFGADACAHEAALNAGLHTIAIPGSGLSDTVIGPQANLDLAKRILHAGGALLSEHPPEYRAAAYDFPSRNRIMVGLSDAVLVIESGEKSGSLISARFASEYNRELLFVPHRIGDPHGAGAHQFIRLGAVLVSKPEHLLEALRLTPRTVEKHSVEKEKLLADDEKQIISLVRKGLKQDELLRASGVLPHIALSVLARLELRGVIEQRFGLWRVR
jgi:DNA processing protein